jgi:FtsP/CotA-like multicopper oxidase with cupredoxin domain
MHTGATGGPRLLLRRAWRCLGFFIAMLAAQNVLLHAFQPATASAQEARQAAQRSYELRIEKGKLAPGAKSLRAIEGEQVALRWVSDEPTTLHLHGYDVELVLVPGTPGAMTFQAYATGRFPITVHGHGHADKPAAHKEKTLVYLEVHPR